MSSPNSPNHHSSDSSSSDGEDDQIMQTMQQHLLNYLRSVLNGSNNGQRVRIRTVQQESASEDDEDDQREDNASDSDSDYYVTDSDEQTISLETEHIKKEFLDNMEKRLESLKNSDFGEVVGGGSESSSNGNVFHLLRERMQYNDVNFHRFDHIHDMTVHCVPNYQDAVIEHLDASLFCGQFSKDGDIFVSACQDQVIRLYNVDDVQEILRDNQQRRLNTQRATAGDGAPRLSNINSPPTTATNTDDQMHDIDDDIERVPSAYREVYARDIGWSIIDVNFSPDQRHLIYSSWSPFIHLIDITTGHESTHVPLNLDPEGRFCGFSIQFSPNSKEILVGGSNGHIYIYDLERNRRTLGVDAHDGDVNTVKFAQDNDDNVFYSGSDDTTCKIWDRRVLSEAADRPVGVLNGHSAGITHIDSKGDGRYFVSNSKDQTLKLWDIRRMCDPQDAPLRISPNISRYYDYRYQVIPSRFTYCSNPNDQSLTTYTGHRILRTLIRCYFSPMETTGQRYVITGSFDGSVFIYDLLTGKIVQKLTSHAEVVRDCAWHPRMPFVWSSGWDGMVLSPDE
eukprot:CAMPEP_0117455138 /NCGR_PEP_ID=MMETSP0759-20121206/11197_1 /TAXON_ID=63605 /ORGANISM="Percolomonas cosmopolitus, Strain WS" /LENGTH=565 /DNA_ID=CAMNT_0005248417 /DNA_START=193 /DNA_END=1890 /DNA_ORIENTATION=+